ncbi:cytochrome P450 2F3-like [Dreissena polymorpha]|uniref:cytochrome P450 2F3-like n=1 Tax=Dreissena polymorpha TaxID=45954 RepID=UPI002264AD1D|nr:cytochrome P450 2F3-like [Dreissena polymorpha]
MFAASILNIFPLQDSTGVLVFIVTFLLIYWSTRRHPGIPPGPGRWPIIGNLGSLAGPDKLKVFRDLRLKYGDVFALYFGSELTVILNGYEAIKDAFLKQGRQFSFRPENDFVRRSVISNLIFGNGPECKAKRVCIMNAFRDLCFTRNGVVLEQIVHDELDFLIEIITKNAKAFCPRKTMSMSFASVIFNILHGKRPERGEKRFQWYMDTLDQGFEVFLRSQVRHYCFPWLDKLPGDLLRLQYAKDVSVSVSEFFEEIFKEREAASLPGSRDCLLDFFLSEDSPVARDEIWKCHHDLMGAGSETSATTMNWMILLLALYPDVQAKLYAEITRKIGKELPAISDRSKIPYVEAVILETLRIGSIVPLGVPHFVKEDVSFRGFLIPKGTTVIAILSSVHHDPSVFSDPYAFRPERFLDESGLVLQPSEQVIPFSMGQRSCIGESIARIELFLYVTRIVQNVEFKLPAGCKRPTSNGVFGLTYRPEDYDVDIKKRN